MKIVGVEKKLVHKLVEECKENVKEGKLAKITSAENENKDKCSSYTLCIVLFSIAFAINVGIGTHVTHIKFGIRTQTTI